MYFSFNGCAEILKKDEIPEKTIDQFSLRFYFNFLFNRIVEF